MLIYCGATNVFSEDADYQDTSNDIRQIDYITRILGDKLNMNVAQFTSKEDMEQRRNLIERFKEGEE